MASGSGASFRYETHHGRRQRPCKRREHLTVGHMAYSYWTSSQRTPAGELRRSRKQRTKRIHCSLN
ncbi:hypothetical protein AMTR_s00042p00209390 [Amborella trichopoda]|uniref:Uncharacterized protein n=1 Tax=Amborella trichopoda TaxID=13333 RepID=W1P9E4_AMBTC|nr:hypothetical protein AMTR_s00042p00209390 [Amborella trichopoda]